MLGDKNKLFCEINPTCYAISLQKEILKRHIKNLLSDEKFAKTKQEEKMPNVIANRSSNLIKRGKGIDVKLQTLGNTTKRKGYKEGRVIRGDKIQPGVGGGLCNLGNTIHWLVLHSPLEVVEFHKHSDALAPDEGKRVPFSSGTSVSYNSLDYRFKNNTDQDVQIFNSKNAPPIVNVQGAASFTSSSLS